MRQSFYTEIEESFPSDRGRVALEVADRSVGRSTWSFAEIASEAARAASLLADLGLQKGDRVAVQVEKSPEALMLYLGCLRGGYVFLPMNTAYREDEVDYLVGNAEPALIVFSSFLFSAREFPKIGKAFTFWPLCQKDFVIFIN